MVLMLGRPRVDAEAEIYHTLPHRRLATPCRMNGTTTWTHTGEYSSALGDPQTRG